MMARYLFSGSLVTMLAVSASPASGQSPASSIESRSFHFHPGTVIERSTDDCMSNIDWLLVRAPGIANAARVDVSPPVSRVWDNGRFPSTACVGPDCLPVFLKVTSRDAAGPRTVTVKYGEGRTATTTFEVVANAGRCDFPKKR